VPDDSATFTAGDSSLSDAELRLTACLYVMHQAHKYLREHGRLPDTIGGAYSVIPMNILFRTRGRHPTLTEDELLVYNAIKREGRLPGGAVRLIDLE
jgi:hypothetical protein